MQEFLVVAAIALVIIFVPRLMARKPAPTSGQNRIQLIKPLTGLMRLAILVTGFWIAGSAAFLAPWNSSNIILFLYVGLGPVAAGWGAFWVWCGYIKFRR